MSPTSYLAAPPRDIALQTIPRKEPTYNTKKREVCQLFFTQKWKKIKLFSWILKNGKESEANAVENRRKGEYFFVILKWKYFTNPALI